MMGQNPNRANLVDVQCIVINIFIYFYCILKVLIKFAVGLDWSDPKLYSKVMGLRKHGWNIWA
jgi:hypothetical protein